MSKTINIGWSLKSIQIQKETWGANRGQYTGKIVFESGSEEQMSMNIPQERCQEYMNLLAQDIVASAHDLGARIANSIIPPALPPVTEINIEAQS